MTFRAKEMIEQPNRRGVHQSVEGATVRRVRSQSFHSRKQRTVSHRFTRSSRVWMIGICTCIGAFAMLLSQRLLLLNVISEKGTGNQYNRAGSISPAIRSSHRSSVAETPSQTAAESGRSFQSLPPKFSTEIDSSAIMKPEVLERNNRLHGNHEISKNDYNTRDTYDVSEKLQHPARSDSSHDQLIARESTTGKAISTVRSNTLPESTDEYVAREHGRYRIDSEGHRWVNLAQVELAEEPPLASHLGPKCQLRMPDDVYVINMPGEAGLARREQISAKFKAANIDFGFVAPLTEGIGKFNQRRHFRKLLKLDKFKKANELVQFHVKVQLRSFGEFSLAATHRAIYIDMLYRKRPCALIFEDDAVVDPATFMFKLKGILETLPDDYGAVRLGYGMKRLIPRRKRELVQFRGDYIPDISIAYHRICCTEGYLVSALGAWTYATINTPVWARADDVQDPLFRNGLGMCDDWGGCAKNTTRMGLYRIYPHIVIQNEGLALNGSWRSVD